MEFINIALRILGRWLAWLFSGMFCGVFCGIPIGTCFAIFYWLIFLFRTQGPSAMGDVDSVVLAGTVLGSYEGGLGGALSFGLLGLTRAWRPSSQTNQESWQSCCAACKTSIFGAIVFPIFLTILIPVAGAISILKQVMSRGEVFNASFFYGSQIGFFMGLMLGAMAPNWHRGVRRLFQFNTTPQKHLK